MQAYYVIYDKEDASTNTIYGICTSMEKVEESINWLVDKMTEECFMIDPKESGLDREYDYDMIAKQCRDSIGIQKIEHLDDIYY